MSWVETLLLVSFGAFAGGMLARRHPLGNGIALVSMVVLVTLLLVFGDEFFSVWF